MQGYLRKVRSTSAYVGNRNALYPIPDACFVNGSREAKEIMERGDKVEANQVVIPKRNNHQHTVCCICHKKAINLARSYTSESHLITKHYCMGHTALGRICLMEEWDTGKKVPADKRKCWCIHCQLAKSHAKAFRKLSAPTVLTPLMWVSADLKVDLPLSVHGFRHYLVIVEWWSEHFWTFLLRKKSEGSKYLLFWMKMAMTSHPGLKIQNLKMDDEELNTNEVGEFCESKGTTFHPNLASEHKQNAKVERSIRTIDEMKRAIILAGSAPDNHWEFAVAAAPGILARMPSMRALRSPQKVNGVKVDRPKTPHEKWTGKSYDSYTAQQDQIYPLFCECVAHSEREKEQ